MFEVDEKLERLADYRVRADALDVRDETDAAGVVLITGPVQASLVTFVVHGDLSSGPIREKRHV